MNGLKNELCFQDKAVVSFRVVVLRADGSLSLFRIEPTLTGAVKTAWAACDRHLVKLRSNRLAFLLDSKRPRTVYVQAWRGTATAGAWVDVPKDKGGYEFTFFDYAPRTRRAG